MKNNVNPNNDWLRKELMGLYSKHDFRTKAYAYLRIKLCPIIESASYVPQSGRVLDLGCGTGLFANILYLSSSQRKVMGVDRSTARIKTAQKICKDNPQLEFAVGDVNNISIGECDIITLIDLLHHIPFNEQDELLRKIYNRLQNTGMVIIKDLEKAPYWKYIFHYLQDSISYKGSRLYFRSTLEMEKLLLSIGFKVETNSLAAGYPHPHVLYSCTKNT